MKIHYQDNNSILFGEYVPPYKGYDYTICGYQRKLVTYEKEKVTCFYCLKILERIRT